MLTWLFLLTCVQHRLFLTLEWTLIHNHGVDYLPHYLDDFLTLGPPASDACLSNLATCLQLCSDLGLPLQPNELEGPIMS